jgi:hypothetical protein
MVSLLLSWHLFAQERLRSLFLHLSAGLHLLGLRSMEHVPTKNAFVRRRKQLGGRIFRWLFRRVGHPLASPQTPGAFAFGSRLTAIDGTQEEVAARQAHARFFGRLSEGKTASPSPQTRYVSLVEMTPHLIFDAIGAPARRANSGCAGASCAA